MGIISKLRKGKITLNHATRCIDLDCPEPFNIPFDTISPTDWGHVYEKYVGQLLETEGYTVHYQGLDLGFADRGIDLVAIKDQDVVFIQCKYKRTFISKKSLDWILYKASNELYRKHAAIGRRITFMLVVRSKDRNFTKRIPKGFQLNFTPADKITYPMLQYFLDHNHVQDKVRLAVREIELPIEGTAL